MDAVCANILSPLALYYNDVSAVEVRMNAPYKVVTDRRGEGVKLHEDKSLTLGAIKKIAKSLANLNGLEFGDNRPSLSCRLPEGHRFECLVGASSENGLSLAIRCKHGFTPTWSQLGLTGKAKSYLSDKINASANMIIAGATNTGKTTLLNRLLSLLPDNRRVVACEDTAELNMSRFWDGVRLIAARHEQDNSGMLSWRKLYDHMMRITPDNVIFGEISTENAFAALGALNSGITGFMCTIHAESPLQAINRKFDQNIAWSGQSLPQVPEFLSELIDVVVQIKRNDKGFRKITDIFEPKNKKFVLQNNKWVG